MTVVENHLAPGGSFGWHSHPGPSFIVVRTGTITFYDGDDPACSPEVVHAGQAVIDAGNHVTRLLPAGAAARIDQPSPGNCDF